MTNPAILEAAVEAVTDALQQFALTEDRDGERTWEEYARAILEAAAPHLRTPREKRFDVPTEPDDGLLEWAIDNNHHQAIESRPIGIGVDGMNISDEAAAVEAAARALWHPNEHGDEWATEFPAYKDYLRAEAIKALEAAVPHLLADISRSLIYPDRPKMKVRK